MLLEPKINESGAPGGREYQHNNVVGARILSMVSVKVKERQIEAPIKALASQSMIRMLSHRKPMPLLSSSIASDIQILPS